MCAPLTASRDTPPQPPAPPRRSAKPPELPTYARRPPRRTSLSTCPSGRSCPTARGGPRRPWRGCKRARSWCTERRSPPTARWILRGASGGRAGCDAAGRLLLMAAAACRQGAGSPAPQRARAASAHPSLSARGPGSRPETQGGTCKTAGSHQRGRRARACLSHQRASEARGRRGRARAHLRRIDEAFCSTRYVAGTPACGASGSSRTAHAKTTLRPGCDRGERRGRCASRLIKRRKEEGELCEPREESPDPRAEGAVLPGRPSGAEQHGHAWRRAEVDAVSPLPPVSLELRPREAQQAAAKDAAETDAAAPLSVSDASARACAPHTALRGADEPGAPVHAVEGCPVEADQLPRTRARRLVRGPDAEDIVRDDLAPIERPRRAHREQCGADLVRGEQGEVGGGPPARLGERSVQSKGRARNAAGRMGKVRIMMACR